MRAFAQLHPVDGLSFRVRSEIPLEAGLGSSGAAIVAGLVAADHMYELALERDELMQHAAKVEGHPDNVAASLYGELRDLHERGVTVIEPPAGLEAVAVVPHDAVPTTAAREALPAQVPLADATFNVARAATLALGPGPRRPRRDRARPRGPPAPAAPAPSVSALDGSASSARADLGALGATISGAGPTVLFWVFFEQTGALVDRLREEVDGWAEIRRLNFVALGADVAEL